MKVLLIFQPQSNPASTGPSEMLLEEAGSFPPLGLLHIATAVIRQGRHEIKIIDSILEGYDFDDIEQIVRREKPDIVGIGWNTEFLRDGYLTAKAAKRADPKVTVIVGGPHVFIYPQETINIPEVDYAVRGEADIVFPEMLDRLESGKAVDDLDGVIVKNRAYTVYPLAIVEDPDTLPIPDRRLLPYERYASLIAAGSPITTIMSSRGCCFKCPFCPAGGTKIRDRSVANVIAEVEDCLALGIRDILFFDELFTFNRQRVMELCSEITRRKLKFRWHVRARIQTMDKAMLEAMESAGCRLIQFGIETGTERIQKLLGKNIPLSKIREIVADTRKAGILAYGNFMICSPTETEDEVASTVQFAVDLKLDFAIFALTRLLPGTDFYSDAVKSGQSEDFWQKYAADPNYNIPRAYAIGKYSEEELRQIAFSAYRKFYLRPGYVFNYMFRIASLRLLAVHARAGFKFFMRLLCS